MALNSFHRTNIIDLSLFLFVGLCSAYITSVTSFSPYYFGYVFSVLLLFLYQITKNRIPSLKRISSVCVILFLYFLFLLYNYSVNNSLNLFFGAIIILCVNQMSTIITFSICEQVKNPKKKISDGIHLFYSVSVIFGLADFIYRLFTSEWNMTGKYFFYNFKMHALMFLDSNWTGFLFMLEFAFFFYLKDKNLFGIKRKHLLMVFLIVVLSVSRAAMLSCVMVIVFSKIKKYRRIRKLILPFLVCCLVFVSPFMITVLSKDDSFSTKLRILNGLAYYFKHMDLFKLFVGLGPLGADNLSLLGDIGPGLGGHLYLIVKIMDIGLIGLFFELLFLFFVIRLTGGEFFYIFLPFIICGLSMCPSNLSPLYVFAGLMLFIEKNARSKKWI